MLKFLFILLVIIIIPLLPVVLNKLAHYMKKHARHKKISHHHQLKVDEAHQVLELKQGATEDEIRSAHKRLIQMNHPDSGGSQYLASKINEARDVLLKNLSDKH